MAATASHLLRLRRATGLLNDSSYADAELREYVEKYPLLDGEGLAPDATDWTPTYDLNAAIGDVWEEKAAGLAADFDFSADGGSYSRSQAYTQAMQQVRHYRSRRVVKTVPIELSKPDEPILDESA